MIRAIAATLLSAGLLVFASGCGAKQQPKPDAPNPPTTDQPAQPKPPAPPATDKPKDHPAH